MASGSIYYQIMPAKVFYRLDSIEDSLRSKIKGFCPDNLKEVLSIISCHVQKSDGTAPLKIEYIKKLVPQGDRYLKELIDLKIVIRSGHAIKGQTSYKYSFTPEYFSKYISLPLKNVKLIRRIEQAQEVQRKEAGKSIRGHSEQTKYLRQLTILENYKAYIDSNYTIDTLQYNDIEASAKRIINGDIFYSIDETSGRFHSNITNMAKGLRPYLRVKGEPLVNIDIKNSQPYLSTLILTNPSKVSWLTENPVFALLLQSLKVSLNQDVKNYISLVISGQLYEYLMQEFGREGLELTRDETKRQVLRILFARNRLPKDEVNRKARLIFINRFPTVHRIFSKVRGRQQGDKFNSFKRFAILLQRIESYLMLDIILKRIYRELPDTIAITVHDSVMTGILTNNVEAVKNIMTEELNAFVGFPPKIKIEENIKSKEGKEKGESEEREEIITNQYDATTFVSLN